MALWLLGAAIGFWWFSIKDLRPFDTLAQIGEKTFNHQSVATDLEHLLAETEQSTGSNATVLHFWDPGCACSRFNQIHVQQLIETYAKQGVRFVVVGNSDRPSAKVLAEQVRDAFGPTADDYLLPASMSKMKGIPASPAAAVFDRNGRLAYFGPYSEGAACLAGSGDFVEKILDRLLAGESPRQIKTSVFGCFCDWSRQA